MIHTIRKNNNYMTIYKFLNLIVKKLKYKRLYQNILKIKLI
jgi:hypothetical protein